MARINGIELKSVKKHKQDSRYFVLASVYMDNKRIGYYSEEEDDRELVRFDCEEDRKQDFMKRVRNFFDKYRVPDEEKIGRMTPRDYLFHKEKQPVVCPAEYDDLSILKLFIRQIILLHEAEQNYKKAVKQGYQSVLAVHYLHFQNRIFREDEYYYVGRNETEAEVRERLYEEETFPVLVKYYRTGGEFSIE